MEKLFPFLLLSFLLSACQNEPKQPAEDPDVLVLESMTTERNEGECDTQDGPCARIALQYPVVKSGLKSLQKSIHRWTNDFLVAMLDPGLEEDDEVSLDDAIEGFVEMHQEMVAEMPDLPTHYVVEVTDTVLLHNEKYLTLRMDGYSYTGGAHPNAFAAIATFDLNSGQRLDVDDLVNDTQKLESLAEQHFRKERADVFAEGFEFDEGWPFAIATNVGLSTEGLFFCYVPYEVTPYALGFTEFVIPFDELKELGMEQ